MSSVSTLPPDPAAVGAQSRLARAIVWSVAALLGLLFAYLTWVALRLEVDYFDSFQAFGNGRTIAAGGGPYSTNRAPLFPALYALLALAGDAVAFRLAHLLGVVFFALLVFASYKLLRLSFPPVPSWLGAALVGTSAQLVHVAPMFKEDLFVTLLTVGAFYFYRRERLLGAGVLLGLIGAAKYNLLPLVLVVLAAHELATRKVSVRRGLALVVLPLLVVTIVVALVFSLGGRASVLNAPAQYIADFQEVFRKAQTDYQRLSPFLAYQLLLKMLSPPIAACAALGVVVSVRGRRPGTLIILLWLGVVLLASAHWVAHKEARYLFPVLPACAFFAIVGANALVSRAGRVAGPLVAVALAAWPMINLARELRRFSDPIYTENFARGVSEAAATLAGSHRIFWFGPSYPVHPRDFVFDREDVTTSIYHFAPHVTEYYTRRLVLGPPSPPGPRWAEAMFRHPAPYTELEDGDVFIVNTELTDYATNTLPERLAPLQLLRVKGLQARPAPGQERLGSPGGLQLELQRSGSQYVVTGRNFPGEWAAVRIDAGRAVLHAGVLPIAAGTFTTPALPAREGDSLTRITILWLEPQRQFALPR